MFGVLVFGGSMLVHAEEPPKTPTNSDDAGVPGAPSATESAKPAESQQPAIPSKKTEARSPTQPATRCQLEFTLNKYSQGGVKHIKTCFDGKSDAEILKMIEEAKKQTCRSPFCGCWLG